MAEQLPHGADVVAAFERMGGEGMAQRMQRSGFGDASRDHLLADRALHRLLRHVVAADHTGARINRAHAGPRHILQEAGESLKQAAA